MSRSDQRAAAISDMIIDTLLSKFGINTSHIDKVKEILDMVEFTLVDGEEIILIEIGDNVQIKIKK